MPKIAFPKVIYGHHKSARKITPDIAAMQKFGINDHKIIERWERIYLEEGPEGLSVERRGRNSTGRPKKLPKETEEDLLAEVQRLRAENDYLKNLQALVLEDERRQRRKRR